MLTTTSYDMYTEPTLTIAYPTFTSVTPDCGATLSYTVTRKAQGWSYFSSFSSSIATKNTASLTYTRTMSQTSYYSDMDTYKVVAAYSGSGSFS